MNSSSSLPTANNSFYTISSPEYEKNTFAEEYQGLGVNLNVNANPFFQIRKGSWNQQSKNSEDCESLDGALNSIGLQNSSLSLNYKNKKSDDFKEKFKTETCKFWELDNNCKFGENV
jgi:hypothetical protein